MINKDFLENLFKNVNTKMSELDSEIDDVSDLTEEELYNNISNFTSEKLCEIVVIYRYLGMYKDLSIKAMEELMNRKSNDNFDFENYINNKLDSYPKLSIKIPDLSNIFKLIK